jgi:hypothetical protein
LTAYDADTVERDLAFSRCENEKLQAQISILGGDPTVAPEASTPGPRRPQSRYAPGAPLRCLRCGLTLHAATIQHEQALVFASCCPRCDGQLTTGEADNNPADPRSEPSIYLG